MHPVAPNVSLPVPSSPPDSSTPLAPTSSAAGAGDASRPAATVAATSSVFFDLWEAADRQVPYPFLYRWVARPMDGQPVAKLQQLSSVDFVYRITNDFSAHLTSRRGAFSPAILSRESMMFRLMPMQGRQGFIPPEQAELAIEKYLEQRPPDGGPTLEAYRAWPWASLLIEQPFAAGVAEPVYRFRKAGGRHEFTVGVRSGLLKCHSIHGEGSPASDSSHPPSS